LHNEGKKVNKISVCGGVKGYSFASFIASGWVLVKGVYYFTTSEEEADKLIEVANAIPVNRSTKAIPINRLYFLFIVTKILIRSDSDSCFSNVA
jgi:hypothetical protein